MSEAALAALEGMDADVASTETVLHGPVDDQTGLHGLLDRIQSLGLELVEVRRLPPRRHTGHSRRRVPAPPGGRRAPHGTHRRAPLPVGPDRWAEV